VAATTQVRLLVGTVMTRNMMLFRRLRGFEVKDEQAGILSDLQSPPSLQLFTCFERRHEHTQTYTPR
jgi:hypothetical protein